MKSSDKSTSIYGLIDPRTQELRYVGKTVKRIGYRLCDHISAARRGAKTYRHNWIRGLLADGLRPDVFLIEEVGSCCDWQEAESFWIEYYRSIGARLTNLTQGGEGTPGYVHSAATRALVSELKRELYVSDPIRRLEHGKMIRKSSPQARSLSGFRGVTFERDRWRAAVKISDISYILGRYPATEGGRVSAARACDRFEIVAVGVDGFALRLPHEARDSQDWARAHDGLTLDKAAAVLRQEAKHHAPLRVNNHSGYRGVTLHKKADKWQARAFIAGRAYSIGLFPYTDEGKIAAAGALDAFECERVGTGHFAPRLPSEFNAEAENDNVQINGMEKAA